MDSENKNNENNQTNSTKDHHYQNPFNLHFHVPTTFPFNPDLIPLEKKIIIEPNQIKFPEKIDPRHQTLTEDIEEFKHFRNIIAAFLNYKFDSLRDVARMEKNFNSIGELAKQLKYDYHSRIQNLKDAIDTNYNFLMLIIEEYFYMFNLKFNEENEPITPNFLIPYKDISKMRSTLKQFVRDWSAKGKEERDMCYTPIKEEFKKYFPNPVNPTNNSLIKVLFPGAGLGRLVYDFAVDGYAAQGNEFSYFMLVASNFVLNMMQTTDEFEIQPFIHTFSNTFEEKDPFEIYKIPDVCPADNISPGHDFSMVAGEFVEVYKKQIGEWDSVITCFFIDTANNIIDYIETIHNILKKGGVWINFGPLLYHYADMQDECSIELSWEEIKYIIVNMGFEIKQESVRQSTYASERKTMMNVIYNCIFFTAVKLK